MTESLEAELARFFRSIATSEIGRNVAGTGVTTAFELRDPAARIVLDTKNPPAGASMAVHAGPGGPPPDVTFATSATNAERIFTGDLAIMAALATGKVKATGALQKAMRLVPAFAEWMPAFRAFRAEGQAER
jgi:hypothetical protein